MNRNDFFYPRSRYRGEVKPQHLVFNANLQEFSHKVSYLTNLQSSGKITPEDAFQQIETLWEQLKVSQLNLGIDSLRP